MEVIKCSRCRGAMEIEANAKKIFKTCKQCRDKKSVKKPKQADVEPRKADVETQKQADVETQKQADVETQKQADVETQKQADVETQKQADVETQKQADVETQKQADVQITDDRQFNLYYEYSIVNSILNKQKLKPFTIWIYKMRDVVSMIYIQHKIQIVIRHFKKVLIELVHECAYPRWKYLFNSCVWEIDDKYTTYVNNIEIVNNMLL